MSRVKVQLTCKYNAKIAGAAAMENRCLPPINYWSVTGFDSLLDAIEFDLTEVWPMLNGGAHRRKRLVKISYG